MKNEINFKRVIKDTFDNAIERITTSLKSEGFGILTRIDFHSKMKEKLDKDIAPVVILGACNPAMAYEAYLVNTDITSLLPCNAVVRDIGNGNVSIELLKPTAMMTTLGNDDLVQFAKSADETLKKVLERT